MDKDTKIACFWEKFVLKSKRYGIKDKNIRWYVKYAEQYINTHNTRLALHTAQTLDAYLDEKGRNSHMNLAPSLDRAILELSDWYERH